MKKYRPKEYQPSLQPLATFVSSLMDLADTNPFKMSRKYEGVANTTLVQLKNSLVCPQTYTLAAVSSAIAEELKLAQGQGLIKNVVASVKDAAYQVNPELKADFKDRDLGDVIFEICIALYPKPSSPPQPVQIVAQNPAIAVFHHFKKLSSDDRMTIAADMLRTLAADIDAQQKRSAIADASMVDRLAIALRQCMSNWQVKAVDEFAVKVLEKYELRETHSDRSAIVQCVTEILEKEKFPEILDPAFNGALGYLAGILEGGRFGGDVTAMLLFFAAPQTEPRLAAVGM